MKKELIAPADAGHIGLNGQNDGSVVAREFMDNDLNVGFMRPYKAFNKKTGKVGTYVTVCVGDPKLPTSYKTYEYQTNATLRRDEWKALDDAIIGISRERLGGVEDLRSKGLVYNLGNAMGTTMLEWHDVDDNGEADMTMDGVTRVKNDRPNFQHNYLPIPIIHADYEINTRALIASRKSGNGLDTIGAERAARRCVEKLERMLFKSTETFAFGEKDDRNRNSIYSYTNHPDRNILALGTAWNAIAVATRGTDIVAKVTAAKQVLINKHKFGPYMLYIPTAYETVMDEDYSPNKGNNTIRDRILQIGNIQGIKVIDTLEANNVLLVQMTSDVVRLVNGFGLTNVQWNSEGGMVTNYKVMTIQVPQIRSDQNGNSGIVHMA